MLEKALLPNIRWLLLPSEEKGEDWENKVLMIDNALEPLGYELAEESVYLIYSHSASQTLDGRGQCFIGRPVIGPKKDLEGPFVLRDWIAATVWKETLSGRTLEELLHGISSVVQGLNSQKKQQEEGFIICLRRKLEPRLTISIEAIFPE